jgi:lyso-ornithine lipid O-acyltransferase
MWIGSPLRGTFRLLSYLSLTLVMVPLYLGLSALRIRPVVRWMPVAYHRIVCAILGIRVRVHGKLSEVTPTLLVCNHVSYLDIEVLGGLVPGSFVAKAEVATWPFFSTLAKAQRTIFIERSSGRAATR